jgi:hypothetical protein
VFQPPRGAGGAAEQHLSTPNRSSVITEVRFSSPKARFDPVLTKSLLQHESTPDVAPPAYSSPSDFPSKSESKSSFDEKDIKSEDSGTALGSVAATVTTVTKEAYEELKAELASAKQKLAAAADQSGLRQRKTTGSDEKLQPAGQRAQQVRQGTEGVPIKIAAALCLLSFLLAYLFF